MREQKQEVSMIRDNHIATAVLMENLAAAVKMVSAKETDNSGNEELKEGAFEPLRTKSPTLHGQHGFDSERHS